MALSPFLKERDDLHFVFKKYLLLLPPRGENYSLISQVLLEDPFSVFNNPYSAMEGFEPSTEASFIQILVTNKC